MPTNKVCPHARLRLQPLGWPAKAARAQTPQRFAFHMSLRLTADMKLKFCDRRLGTLTILVAAMVAIAGLTVEKLSASQPADAKAQSSSRRPKPAGAGDGDSQPAARPSSEKKVSAKAQASTSDLQLESQISSASSDTLDDEPGLSLSSSDGEGDGEEDELSIEAQQAKDQGECPGSEEPQGPPPAGPDDLPLEQDEHPFDAPAAQSEARGAAVEEANDDVEQAPPAPAATKDAAQSARQQQLQRRINLCLAHYFTHRENLALRSPWAVMHTILPFGVETDIIAGNRNVNAIGWMCYNGVCKTQRMFHPTQRGFRTNVGPGVQGHEGQFLAILAQSSVPRDFPILVGKTRYTISDLIRYEMVTCRENSELTFKLIGLSHYLPPRQAWRDDRGQVWNLEKLVREELEQPIVGAACGGTHRLMGLSYALMMRRRYKEPITGHWARADVYINDFVQYTWSLQNPDGSFSTDWFEGRANEPSAERKVQTSGHMLEWLIFTLPSEDLADPRVIKGVEFLLSEVYDHRDRDWPIGPRGHALRAIALYNQRVFGAPTGQLKSHLAQNGFVKELR